MEDGTFPDLIVMDGGEIQVHAALDVLHSLNVDIPVMGIQKNDRHKASKIFYKEEVIDLDKNSPIYLLLADISQRVHDFAISFFRSNKTKGLFSSMLDPIPGLGPKRKEQLLTHFVSIDRIKEATIEDLQSAGISKSLAETIWNYFRKEEE